MCASSLDIGTGLPTFNNTHQVAQRVAPDSLKWRPEADSAFPTAEVETLGAIGRKP